jgi:formylmethanofuran dehydrogenase subunit C
MEIQLITRITLQLQPDASIECEIYTDDIEAKKAEIIKELEKYNIKADVKLTFKQYIF